MKAIVYTEYGPPEVLRLKEVEKPSPKEDEVLIKIHATTVTTGDVNARGFTFIPPGFGPLPRLSLGFRKPNKTILGFELAGVIEAIGQNVDCFKLGDEVFGIDGTGMGAYAEYKCMSQDGALAQKPTAMTFEEAASVVNGALTALYFLREKGNIQREEKVLVNGASGSVGSSAIQLAKFFDTNVTGVCSTKNIDLVKSLGADSVIDYTQEDFTQSGEKYDLILDTVWGKSSFSGSKVSLNSGGRYLAVAGGLKEAVEMLWTSVVGDKKVIFGGGMASERKEFVEFIKDRIEAGELRAVIDRCYPLSQIVEAHRYVDGGHKKGNVVIVVE